MTETLQLFRGVASKTSVKTCWRALNPRKRVGQASPRSSGSGLSSRPVSMHLSSRSLSASIQRLFYSLLSLFCRMSTLHERLRLTINVCILAMSLVKMYLIECPIVLSSDYDEWYCSFHSTFTVRYWLTLELSNRTPSISPAAAR